MSLAIQWGYDTTDPKNPPKSRGFIYFDAVTSYQTDYSGTVTSHPISSGSNITDHFVRDNMKLSVQAVVSGVDISSGNHIIQDSDGNKPNNTRLMELDAVSINQTRSFTDFLPDSIGQFFSPNTPQIQMSDVRRNGGYLTSSQIAKHIEKLFQDGFMQFIVLYEYTDSAITNVIDTLVMTRFNFYEDPDVGDCLMANMSFEKVQIVSTGKTELSKDVAEKYKIQAGLLENKNPTNVQDPVLAKGNPKVEQIDPNNQPFPEDDPLGLKVFAPPVSDNDKWYSIVSKDYGTPDVPNLKTKQLIGPR